ncbi:hypothetical protein ASPZODRAFT_139373 [Penicilliopsis zonata CBS 506.65]|uniref:Uncharacterized protein n=1 Tax=Penicilliopsis zonata CBS 506.65 TaxID=1073090 RepID=A0A1L9SS63_9EURO|nr:hypothetical protein ASPZODRAFT_139373 [Penicilliopsis zonata CBS 506.65]OJJ50038.1 hypothetical protein ASPZODRAFT_139373 [Penicilliopsis zonata CBS 506.65]
MGPLPSWITPPLQLAAIPSQGSSDTRPPPHFLNRRSSTISIPATYGGLNSGPAPGTVAGIVIGSVAGFILFIYLLYLVIGPKGPPAVVDEEVVVRRGGGGGHPPSRRSSRRHNHNDDTVVVVEDEMSEASAGGRYRREEDRIVVDESVSSHIHTEDEFVEVIEQHSSIASPTPPPRRPGGRSYRRVDPNEFGGGDSELSSHY